MVKAALADRAFTDLLGRPILRREPPSRAYIASLFKITLKGRPLEDVAAMLTNGFRDAAEYLELMDDGKTCQRMSLRYNPHRLDVAAIDKLSIFDAMNTRDTFYDGMARAYLAGMVKPNAPDLLYQLIQIGIQGSQYINEFPPHVARDIYREFGLDRRSRILDPCAGWGGRMIGASVVSDHYDGVEPSVLTANGLGHLARDLNALTGTFKARVVCKPFEDVDVPKAKYDFALTSPPYYDTERYADSEDTQSYVRYKSFDEWVIGFYLPFIDKAMSALKPGGAFVLNVGDRKYPLPNVLREHCSKVGIRVRKLPSRLGGGGGLRTKGEGEVFFVLDKEA